MRVAIRIGLTFVSLLATGAHLNADDAKPKTPGLSDEDPRDACLRLVTESMAVVNTSPTLALLLALEANKHHPHSLVNEALIEALARLREARTIGRHNGRASSVAFLSYASLSAQVLRG